MNRLSRRKTLRLAAAAAAASAVAGRSPFAAAPSVVLGEAKGTGQSAQFPLGVYGGYFQRHGIDVSIRQFSSGAEMGPALIAGSLNIIATGDIPGIPIMAVNAPVKALCPISDFTADQAIVANASIKSPEDLIGKKVALFKGAVPSLLISRYAAENKLDIDRISLIHMDPAQQVPALLNGNIDAYASWEPHVWNGVQRVPGAHVLARGDSPTQLLRVYNLLLVREDYLSTNRDMVLRLLKGLVEAQRALETESAIEQAAGYIRDKQGFDMPLNAIISMMKNRRFTMQIDKTFIDAENTNTEFLFNLGRVKTKPSVLSWLDPEPLRQIEPSWVRI